MIPESNPLVSTETEVRDACLAVEPATHEHAGLIRCVTIRPEFSCVGACDIPSAANPCRGVRGPDDYAILTWPIDSNTKLSIHGSPADLEAMLEAALAAVREASVVDAVIHIDGCESATCEGECDDPTPASQLERALDGMAAEDASERPHDALVIGSGCDACTHLGYRLQLVAAGDVSVVGCTGCGGWGSRGPDQRRAGTAAPTTRPPKARPGEPVNTISSLLPGPEAA